MHQRAAHWLLVLLCCYGFAFAQNNPNTDQGMKPYDSFEGGNLDSVSMTSGNLFFHKEIYSSPQRGRAAFNLSLLYNNKGFHLMTNCDFTPCRLTWVWNGSGVVAQDDQDPRLSLFVTSKVVDSGALQLGTGEDVLVNVYTATTFDGSVHQLADTGNGYRSIDGSGILWNNSSNTAQDRTGMYSGGAEDPNGNIVSFNTTAWNWTDTLGRVIPWFRPGADASTASLSSCPQLGLTYQPLTYAYLVNLPGPQPKGTSPFIFCYASVYVRTAFFGGAPASGPTLTDVHTSVDMLQSVVLPDGTAWSFQYDAANPNDATSVGYGDLLKITFPTGGSISYAYVNIGPYSGQHSTGLATSLSRAVVSRTVDANDGAGPQKWIYSWGHVLVSTQSNYVLENTVTDPLGNDTVHQITGFFGGPSLYETQARFYQGSQSGGALLKTVNTDYNFSSNPFDIGPTVPPPTAINVVPIRVTTIWPNGQTSKVEMDHDSGFIFRDPLYGTDSNPPVTTTYPATLGTVTDKREYDYGQGQPGALLRETKTTYQWQKDSRYLAANLLHLPATVQVYDGGGHLCAETDYFYDETTASSPSPAITTQHVAAPGAVRGNPTSIDHKLSNTPCAASATWTDVASHQSWFDTGELQSSTDPMNHTTTHLYDVAYAGAYPTQTCSPQTGNVSHCIAGTYDFGSGLLTSFTDWNGQTSTFNYDDEGRMVSATAPADLAGLHGETDFNYPDGVTVQRTKKQDGSHSIIDYAYFDGLGRTKQTRLLDPEGDDYVEPTYDSLGRVSSTPNPHRLVASSSDGKTTTYYDALGRVVQVAPQDGTLLPAGTPATQCQSNNICTDYSNFPTVTVTDQTGKLRRTRTDGLGYLVEVDEPGAGASTPGAGATGSISISGSLASSTSSGTKATGSFTVNGTEGGPLPTWICSDTCVKGPVVYDRGTISVTVNGFPAVDSYGKDSSANSIAKDLTSDFNAAGSPVTAVCCGSGSTVTLTATTPGPNYSMSTSSSTSDPTDFGGPSFSTTLSGASLTHGVYPVTTYDSGTLTVTVDGFKASASYSESLTNNATDVTNVLVRALNAATSPVTASASGTTITLTAKGVGIATDYTVTGSSTASFTASSTTLINGANAGGIYTPLVTTYTYDTLGNLTGANQAGDGSQPARVRTFTYDSLSRLLTSTNPESGKTTYAYDNDGSLISKTDARGITINYASIDALHRVLQKTYSNGDPAVTFTYDQGTNANGRLSSESVGSISRSFAYDPLGRVVTQTDCLPSGCHTTSVPLTGYNLASELTSLVYPDGRNVTTAFNTAGRMIGVNLAAFNGTQVNAPYYTVPQGTQASAWGYLPTGAMNRGTYGNGLLETIGYNNRLQINSMTDVQGASTLFSKSYGYYDGSGHNNGNVLTITDALSSARNQTFTYDQLNRLASAAESDNGFNVGYSIDAWGNMKESGTSNFTPTFDANNRMQGWSYDAAGNLLNDGAHAYTYDAEGRIKTVDGTAATYTYGPDGERVRKDTSAGSTEYIYFGGSVIAELNPTSGAWTDYIFAGGSRIAKDTSTNASGAQYYQGDHLGTTSMMTDATGAVISSCSYAPYGEQVACSPDNSSNHYRFTGKERDMTESGLDYFGARHYSSRMGRFMTPDWSEGPATVPYAHLDNPQTLNLYSYVDNNPINGIDLDGHSPHESMVDPAGSWGTFFMSGDAGGEPSSESVIVDQSTNIAVIIDNQTGSVTVQAATELASNGVAQQQPQQQSTTGQQSQLAGRQKQPNIPQEIGAIHTAFDKKVAEMTANGQRIGYGTAGGAINNIVSSIQRIGEVLHLTKHHLCSCNEQALIISTSLNSSMRGTSYMFSMKQSLTHSWVVGTSSVRGAPVLVLDPWKNKFEVQPQ